MGRPRRTIAGDGAGAHLARRLQHLQESSGYILEDLVVRTQMSATVISEMTTGKVWPWAKVERFVLGCGGWPENYRSDWDAAVEHERQLPGLGISSAHLSVTTNRREQRQQLRQLAGPPPSPVACSTAEEFEGCLRRVHIWAGEPSVGHLAAVTDIPRSTVYGMLSLRGRQRARVRVPRLELVIRLLQAIGVTEENMLREWSYTWRRLVTVEAERRRKGGRGHLRVV